MRTVETDVAVIGAGPCGVTLANLLGVMGVRTILVDREAGVVPHPRAVAVDDESLRTFQSAGLVDEVLRDVIQNAPIRYHNSRGKVLAHVSPSGRPHGWPRRNLFFQPMMEATLRAGLERFDHVEWRPGTEVTALEQDQARVLLRAKSETGDHTIVARFVVGADGGRSFVRDAVNIDLRGSTAPSRWLVVDVADDSWDAMYSAVYCDPLRPSMTIPLPYGHRRFEFKLLANEDENVVSGLPSVRRLLARFYPDGEIPPVMRQRVYWHHSRTAATFQHDRVFLAGDAAHLQPPFFGQGMNSGIRDATNLAWKLAMVTSDRAHRSLLETYDLERRGHAEQMVEFATRIGRMYEPRNRLTEIVRDHAFGWVQRLPGARDYILQMKYKPAPRYEKGAVVAATGSTRVGKPYGQPWVVTASGERRQLDDVVGPTGAIVGLHTDPAAALSEAGRERLHRLGFRSVQISPAPTAVRHGERRITNAEQVFDVDGSFRDELLAHPGEDVVILRPDRYVAATCASADLDGTFGAWCRVAGFADGRETDDD